MIEVGVVSKDETIVKKIIETCKEFDYSYKFWPDLESFMDESPDCMVVITNASENKESKVAAAECAQVAKGICRSAFTVCIVDKAINKDDLPFLKKSGADLILLEDELTTTSKLEFLLTQELKARYYPVKVSELAVNTEISFHLYHLMPARGKFLPCAFPNTVLTADKMEKFSKVNELYIIRKEISAYKKYHEENVPQTLSGRCRIRFLNLCASYSELVFLLTDQGESVSFEKGKNLLENCNKLCSELITSVSEFDNVWDIINNSAIGNMGSVERSTAIATYAAIFGMTMGLDQRIDEVMICSLIADLGLLFISPKTLKKIRESTHLTSEEKSDYESHPMASVRIALERKLPMPPVLRKIIEMTHERADKLGFPIKPCPQRIPLESELIQFCQEFDSGNLVKLGKIKKSSKDLRVEMITKELSSTRYSPEFLQKLKVFL